MRKSLLVIPLAVMCIASANVGLCQDKVDSQTTQQLKKEDSLPPATGRTLTEQAGTTEPSSKVKTGTDENVFVNGALSVPGAPKNVDTDPAKFSPRTAADDQLPIAGYRLKQLSPSQRTDIARQLATVAGNRKVANGVVDGFAVVGSELSTQVALESLTPTPHAISEQYPELRGTGFISADNGILIVDLDNNLVVGILRG